MLSDNLIVQKTEQVLVRHWIRTEDLRIRCYKRVLYITGKFERRAGKRETAGDITAWQISKIEYEIRAIKDIKRIRMDLTGWVKDEGVWIRIEDKKKRKKKSS